MPQSQGTRFTADPLTFICSYIQLWDANVEDHSDQGVSIEVAASVTGKETVLLVPTASRPRREATSMVRKIPR